MKADLLRATAILLLLAPWSIATAEDFRHTLPSAITAPIQLISDGSGCCNSCTQGSCSNSCKDCCCCGPSWYASFNLRGSFDELQSGGFNTLGPHPNLGSDNGESFSIGGTLGVSIPKSWGALRLECEGIYVDPFDALTDSFQPPTPTFFYLTTYSDRWAVLANGWFDLPLNECCDFYAGGGIGGAGASMFVDDTVVQGSGSSTDFAWQVGCGITRHYNRASVDLGYRYLDWGTSEVDLNGIGGGGPAGNFTAYVTSHQIFVAIRFDSIGGLLGR